MTWTPEQLKEHYDERFDRLEGELVRKFDGFPQEYATNVETDALRTIIEEMRSDHVHRREIDEVKGELHENTGRRASWGVAAGVVMAILAIMFGVVLQRGITSSDVSNQIQREAPWNRDKGGIERRLAHLEGEETNVELARLQAKVQFLCSTRVPEEPRC